MIENPIQTVPPQVDGEGDFTRRGFVKVILGAVGLGYVGAIGYPVFRYLNSPVEKAEGAAAVTEVNLKDADRLPKGSALLFKFGIRPGILIHHTDDSWIALDAVCTHMACTVEYDPAQNRIICNCHGGVYDSKTGENVSGPPPKPLTKYALTVGKGEVLVKRS